LQAPRASTLSKKSTQTFLLTSGADAVQAGAVPPRYRDVSLALYDSLKEHYV
jgi:hypothetical protein